MVSWKTKDIINESNKKVILLQEEIISSKGNIDKLLIQYMLKSFNIVNQTHVFHLLTKSYVEHVAIGDFYNCIRSNTDSVAELSIGMSLDSAKEFIDTKLEWKYNKSLLLAIIEDYRLDTNNLIDMTNEPSLMSINNVLITIQTAIDELKYKLGLNK